MLQPNIPKVKQSLKSRGIETSTQLWLQEMADRDTKLWGMPHPCWVIDNKMYDLTNFVQLHPGGKSWIELTRGQDITVLFKTHHMQESKTRAILQKYYVGQCPIKNESRFQFTFYDQLRQKILARFSVKQLQDATKTKLVCSLLILFWFVMFSLTGYYQSYVLAFITSLLTMCHYAIGHLFIHKNDSNIFKHVYLLIGFTAREQQIMHAISHHPYANTMLDYEYGSLQPIVYFGRCLPQNGRFVYFVYEILMMVIVPSNIITKLLVVPILKRTMPSYWHAVMLLQIPYLGILCGNWWEGFKLWIFITLAFGFFFGKILLCPHRQDNLWSEGAEQIKDYVIHNICSSSDSPHEVSTLQSLILYSGFNIHILHHLFPTIDHSRLKECNKIFKEFCREKSLNIEHRDLFGCNYGIFRLLNKRIPFDITKYIGISQGIKKQT